MGKHTPADRRKIYVRIADELRTDIASGRYPVGESLPSIAALCDRFGAAKATVERALAVLRDDGLIMSRQGSPSVVVDVPEQQDAADVPQPQGPSEEFKILWSQLQELRALLRRQAAKLDELDERTRNL